MELINIELRCLKADEGKVLTNGEAYSSVGGEIYLGVNDSIENWHEITEEEYNQKKKELELVQDENLY
jgi:hypothetical protein